ncbi:hypothetical protein DFR70_101585 [Nocardia tenerifensis]|uniref:Uncharacterized protein n=1 Tax=Nocardia tenerifensis TaxID=228006 RepID=A0A318KG61_9NOCA|nr:hypothetical protein [Nocardia tenerifensis]PXX71163.1 hypothetical protein DFR70_101585 [Nocardia tenerifensis]
MNIYDTGSRRVDLRTSLSRPLLTIAAVSLTLGVVAGGVSYLDRSPVPEAHVDGTAAWGTHIALFALTVAAGIVVVRRIGVSAFTRLLLSPVTSVAAQRLTTTARSIFHHPTALLRLLAGLLPAAVVVYSPFRMGMQILGGLDPNFTANAWGGPSYLGAMACHYLDALLLIAASTALLHWLLLPADRRR